MKILPYIFELSSFLFLWMWNVEAGDENLFLSGIHYVSLALE